MPAPPLVRVSSNLGGSNVEITEDTPADLLEGCMELRIILPNNRKVRSHYERRTPMMDLLVQIATSQRLAPGDHFLQIADDVTGNPIQFLPSTLLGALDARTVQIVPKNRIIDTKVSKSAKNLNLPFEQTFRLKVYLPRNQLFVTRVSAHTTVSTVLSVICKEKNLDPEKFELRHPGNRDEKLHISATLADYGICEVALVATGKLDPAGSSWSVMSRTSNSNGSSATNVQPPKQKKGLFSFMFGKKQSKSSMGDSSLSSDSIGDRSLSPSRSQSPGTPESVSPATPPLATSSVISAPTQNGRMAPAKSMETISLISDTSSSRGMSRFKKRQAPIPPPTNRMSSPLSKEQLSKLPGGDYKLSSPFSKSTTNLYYENRAGNRLSMSNLTSTNSTSTSSILSAIRKGKKAPPPPNPPPQESEQIKREELRVEEVHLPPEPDGQIKEAGVVSSGVEDIVKPSSPQPCVDPVRSSPVEVENDKKVLVDTSAFTNLEQHLQTSPLTSLSRAEQIPQIHSPPPKPLPRQKKPTEASAPIPAVPRDVAPVPPPTVVRVIPVPLPRTPSRENLLVDIPKPPEPKKSVIHASTSVESNLGNNRPVLPPKPSNLKSAVRTISSLNILKAAESKTDVSEGLDFRFEDIKSANQRPVSKIDTADETSSVKSGSVSTLSFSDGDFGSDIEFDEDIFVPKSENNDDHATQRKKWGTPLAPVIKIDRMDSVSSVQSEATEISSVMSDRSRRSSFE